MQLDESAIVIVKVVTYILGSFSPSPSFGASSPRSQSVCLCLFIVEMTGAVCVVCVCVSVSVCVLCVGCRVKEYSELGHIPGERGTENSVSHQPITAEQLTPRASLD